MTPIREKDILVVPKESKVEYDCRRLGRTERRLELFYKRGGYDPAKIRDIFESHEIQLRGRQQLQQLLPDASFVFRRQFTPEALKGKRLVISYGGDNHLQFLARYITRQSLLGVIADPQRSDGCLMQATMADMPEAVEKLATGRFAVESWSRFKIHLDGHDLPFPVLCEAFFGEHHAENMSRSTFVYGGHSYKAKGSGLLVYTGAGSTGWAYSAGQHPFAPTANEYRFVTLLPYRGRLSPSTNRRAGHFPPGAEFTVTSMNDAHGVVILDALDHYEFREGCHAGIRPAAPLKVVSLK